MKTALNVVVMVTIIGLLTAGSGLAGAVDGLQAIPVDEDQALVFSASADVKLILRTANPTGQDVRLIASGRPFQGVALDDDEREKAETKGETVVAYGVSKYYRIDTLADQTVGSDKTTVSAGTGQVYINLGKLPTGLYMLDLDFFQGNGKLSNMKYPLFVAEDIKQREYKPPVLPVGVYTRYMAYRRAEHPLWWKTYCHAMALDLRNHNVNTVIACGGFYPGEVDIYNHYGLAGISRAGLGLDHPHPGVLASLVSDEPHPGDELEELKQMYEELRKKTDAIIMTCMVGESTGLGTAIDPVNLWKELNPQVRLFRWYGVKKHFYDALYPLHYKGNLPFTSVLRIVEASSDIAWWVIVPSFGRDMHEAYYQNPSPEQIRCMVHLSLAYGADGIMFYQYQEGLVDSVTLRPRDGQLAAVAEVIGKTQAHAELLRSLKHAGLDIRCPSPVVEAIPLGGEDRPFHIYVVNKDAKHSVSTHLLLWVDVWEVSKFRDLYSGRDLPITRDTEGYWSVPLALAPGEGKLIVTDAKQRTP